MVNLKRKTSKEIREYLKEQKVLARARKGMEEEKYKKSATSRIGRGISKVFRLSKKGELTKAIYSRGNKLTKTGGIKTGKKGRPRGSYDIRYSKYGGVYGYRKYMAHKRRMELLRERERLKLTERQRIALQRIKEDEIRRSFSRESRTIPDTEGKVNLSGIMKEIDYSSNIIP